MGSWKVLLVEKTRRNTVRHRDREKGRVPVPAEKRIDDPEKLLGTLTNRLRPDLPTTSLAHREAV
jgi:hypothetical protein